MKKFTKTMRSMILIAVSMLIFVFSGIAQQTMLLTESFETGTGTTPPAGWALEQITGTTLGVNFVTTSTSPTIAAAYDGVKFVQYNAYGISSGSTRMKRTIAVSTMNKSFIMVDFAWYEDPAYATNADKVDVQWSTNGTTWSTAGSFNRYNAVAGWKLKNVVLPNGASNQATLYISFLFTSAYGNNCALDLVHVTAGPAAPPAVVTIGTGTVPSEYPYTTYWMGGRTQMLYTAAELTATGATAGNITSIGFNVISNSTQLMNGFNVKLGATALISLAAGYVNGLTSYYTTPYSVPGTGWQNITLTTPFIWNGTSNVLVEICYANTTYSDFSKVYGTSLANKIAGHSADLQTECTTSVNNVPPARPNIRLGVPPITLGALTGYVRDVNTLAPVAGAIVIIGTKRDTSRANGIYIIYNLNSGSVTANCTASGYISGSATANIVTGSLTNLDILMSPGPKVGGFVTDASTGAPIIGATVTISTGANAVTTLTVAGGNYLSPLLSSYGVQPVVIGKTGYDDFAGTVTLVPNTTATQNAALLPTVVQPGPFTAALNNLLSPTAVNLNWVAPQGMYQLIYDDGVQDNFAIWATAGNLNALKITPLTWPAKLIGGKVNLGTAANYPASSLPLAKFKMMAYKADGAGGLPGTKLDSVEVTPTGFGWADFTFANSITINSGDFYLVMRQGGIPPHAAGIGVDLTNSQLRSYSRFVSGGAPWVPAAGNFMIRAIMQGSGGPMLSDNPMAGKELITAGAPKGLIYETPVATITGHEGVADDVPLSMSYQVWRLKQGQEGNQALWTSIWTGIVNMAVDNGWPTLPNGPYRWAVKAIYSPPGQRFSEPTFSNVIGKGWIANVNVCISLTCAANPKAGTVVKLVNTDYPDTSYVKITDTSGCTHFTGIWKGNYQLSVTCFSYPLYTQNLTISGDATYNVMLIQDTAPPTNFAVNDQTLKASWSPPRTIVYQLDEPFANFTANGWIVAGANWTVPATRGNPAPCAEFNYYPGVSGYDQYLTSKSFAGINAPQMKLRYDILLDNYGTTTVNTMAVELWNGAAWSVLKTYSSDGGNFPFTSETIDISSQTHSPAFKIRFHASGGNSSDLNWWDIDNVKIFSTDGTSGPNPCVIGYNFYLNNVQSAFTPDTTYNIPPNQVVYGQNYQACVKAVYGNGYSPQVCVNMTSHFLYPARLLTANGIGCTTYLSWKKPVTASGATPDGLAGYNIYRDGVFIHTNPHQDSITYYDYDRDPGTYKYDVKARYDLAAFGFPGQFGESLTNTAGEKSVTLNCGAPLPFYEPWDIGLFTFQGWSPTGHWTMNTGIGNPAPCADFAWQPGITNYSQALTSEVIDASPWTCTTVWLDFDMKLIDRNNTGKEKLTVDLFYNNTWHQKLEMTNNGSTNWISKHIDISSVRGKSFRVRFVANGVNSVDMLHWYVDNVHAYGVCKPPETLSYTESHNTVNLIWTAPICSSIGSGYLVNYIYDNGMMSSGISINPGYNIKMGNYFPIDPATTGQLVSFDMYFTQANTSTAQSCVLYIYNAAHNLIGTSAPFMNPAATFPSGSWITVPMNELPFTGPFYALVDYQVNSAPFKNYFGYDGQTPQVLPSGLGWTWRDGVFASAVTAFNYAAPVTFLQRATVWVNGKKKELSVNPVEMPVSMDETPIKGAAVNLNSDVVVGCTGHPEAPVSTDASALMGYNVWRTGSTGVIPYIKLNGTPVIDTTFTDVLPLTGIGNYKYYVTSMFNDAVANTFLCESRGSDTVAVMFPAVGIDETSNGRISVFPNPAQDVVTIQSDYSISGVTVLNCTGQTVYVNSHANAKTLKFKVTELKPGVYLVKITTNAGIRTVKISVIH